MIKMENDEKEVFTALFTNSVQSQAPLCHLYYFEEANRKDHIRLADLDFGKSSF